MITTKDAIDKLVIELKTDNGYYQAWKANIAMAFYDSCLQHKKKTGKKSLSNGDIHECANVAAENFINFLMK